jgi:hypothetical protein
MKTKITCLLVLSSLFFSCNNSQDTRTRQKQETVKRETVTKNIKGRIEIKESNQTSFQDVTLKVNYAKTIYYDSDGKIVSTINFGGGYRNYPKLTIEKCSFFKDESLYFTTICNDSGIYETSLINLNDTDSNLKTSTWTTVIIRFKCDDFFSSRSEI